MFFIPSLSIGGIFFTSLFWIFIFSFLFGSYIGGHYYCFVRDWSLIIKELEQFKICTFDYRTWDKYKSDKNELNKKREEEKKLVELLERGSSWLCVDDENVTSVTWDDVSKHAFGLSHEEFEVSFLLCYYFLIFIIIFLFYLND
jgi:hypothetical protein